MPQEEFEMNEADHVLDMPEIRRRNWRHQTSALVQKSALNQWRQYKTNICQMAFPVVMILLLFAIQQLVNSFLDDQDSVIPAFVHPPTLPFPLYQTNLTINTDCPETFTPPVAKGVDMVFVDQTGTFGGLVANYTTPFPPNLMYEGEVAIGRGNLLTYCKREPFFASPLNWTQFQTKDSADASIYTAQKQKNILGGFIFNEATTSTFKYDIYFNETLTRARDIPVFLNMIGSLFLASYTRGQNLTTMMLNGARDFPSKGGKVTFDLIAILGPRFFIYIYQLIFPVILGNIVYEKENKLREIMKMMGLRMSTYWVITYIFSFMIYFIALMVMWALAAALQFRYFVNNNAGLVFLLIFIWGHTLTALALFFSVFFNKSRSAVVVGYIWVFATGLLALQVIGDYFDNPNTPPAVVFVLSCIPPFALYRGLDILGKGIVGSLPGWEFSDAEFSGMQTVFLFLLVEWFVFLILALYLDAVLKTGYGTKVSPIFFLKKSFWRKEKVVHEDIKTSVEGEAPDVAAMRTSMIKNPSKYFMRIEDLQKVYPGDKLSGLKEKVAVKSLALGVFRGECFGFLGPNGAGKSTTINIISGLYRATSGTAIIDGMDINEDSDVAMVMGVCPQDNVLWDNLTGPEHLRFYGRIKNYSGKELDEMVEKGLRAVSLWEDRHKKSHQFSGGMKRRLSVACSLMGNPKLVLLDEPSTGLDPASRRDLWQLISNQKRKCAMLLTTHAMEEADALCDRIGIFMDGELRCVGTSSELKLRYGKGYRISLTVDTKKNADPTEFVRSIAPDATLLNSIAGTYHFEVLKSSVKLSQVFKAFEANKEQFGITDWGISNTTLEEVFLKITGEDKEMLKLSEGSASSPSAPDIGKKIVPIVEASSSSSSSSDEERVRGSSSSNL